MKMQVRVLHVDQGGTGGDGLDSFQMSVNPDMTVAEIRAETFTHLEIPAADQAMVILAVQQRGTQVPKERQLLQFQETAQQVGLNRSSKIRVLQPSVQVKILGGHSLTVLNLASTTLSNLISSVAQKFDIPAGHQVLIFNKAVIKQRLLHMTLFEYGIKDGDSLCIVRQIWDITVAHPQNIWSVTVNVSPRTTMKDVKEQVRGMTEAVISLPLIFSGREIPDDRELLEYEDVWLSSQFSFSFATTRPAQSTLRNLFVSPYYGPTMVLHNVQTTDTIYRVKQMIQDKEDIPTRLQCLVHVGKLLADDRLVKDYGIQEESTLSLTVRQLVRDCEHS